SLSSSSTDFGRHDFRRGPVNAVFAMIVLAKIMSQWKKHPYPSASPRGRIPQFEPAAVIGEDFGDDRETEPGPVRARRHIGFKEPLPVLPWKTHAVVYHVDGDDAPGNRGRHGYLPLESGFAGVRGNPLGRVLDNVRQGLRQKPPVERDMDWAVRQLVLKHDIGMRDPHKEQNLAHAFAEVAAFEARFRHPRERRKFIHHALDVVDLPDDRVRALVENIAVL